MGKGISIFLGIKHSLEENLKYIKDANMCGFDRIFTSLHIPEANYETIIEEFNEITELAYKLNPKISAKHLFALGLDNVFLLDYILEETKFRFNIKK